MKKWTCLAAAVALLYSMVLAATPAPAEQKPHANTGAYAGAPADLDIYILIGQSNMAGRAKIEEADKLPIERFYLADANGQFVPAVHPLNAFSTVRKGLGMQKLNLGDAFARTMLAKMPKAKSVGLLVQARGGSNIESWAKGSRYYKELLKRVAMVKGRGTIRGILWHQGESNNGQDDYLPKLVKLVADLRADLKNAKLPFVVGQIRQAEDTAVINNQLAALPKTVKHTACAESKGLKTQDRWHFESASLRELGRRYARAMASVQASGGGGDASLAADEHVDGGCPNFLPMQE